MSRGLAAALGVEALLIAALLTLALDQYLHAQGEPLDGINTWGYRGAVAKQRAYDETRIMMVGGTRAFEPGVAAAATVTSHVRFMIERWVTFDRGPVTAVNIALPRFPRGGYALRLDEFRYLDPDAICILVDLTTTADAPRTGLITRWTGYVPVLAPLAAIDRELGRLLGATPALSDDIGTVADAVLAGVSIAPTVVAVPAASAADETIVRTALLASLERFAGDRRVAIVELKDGPPVMVAGLMRPAAAVQIEPAVSAFLRARTASR